MRRETIAPRPGWQAKVEQHKRRVTFGGEAQPLGGGQCTQRGIAGGVQI